MAHCPGDPAHVWCAALQHRFKLDRALASAGIPHFTPTLEFYPRRQRIRIRYTAADGAIGETSQAVRLGLQRRRVERQHGADNARLLPLHNPQRQHARRRGDRKGMTVRLFPSGFGGVIERYASASGITTSARRQAMQGWLNRIGLPRRLLVATR